MGKKLAGHKQGKTTPLTEEDFEFLARQRGFEIQKPIQLGNKTKNTWVCSKGHKWESRFNNIQLGQGCPCCAGNTPLTEEDFESLAQRRGLEIQKPIRLGNKTVNTWRCAKGHVWKAAYSVIRRGSGCPYCSGNARLTPQRFEDLARQRGFAILPPITLNSKAKNTWVCSKGHEWVAPFSNIQNGSNCPHCAGNAHHTELSFDCLARSRGFTVKRPLIVHSKAKNTWVCSEGHEWVASYNSIHKGTGCPYCSHKVPVTEELFESLARQRGFEIQKPIILNSQVGNFWQCRRGHVWKAAYSVIRRGSGCPRCASLISRPEVALRAEISRMYPDTQGNVRKLLRSPRLELDIYIPSLRKAIEYDGWRHFEDTIQIARDQRKNQQCAEIGIALLRVNDKAYNQDPHGTTKTVLDWLAGHG